MLQTQRLPDRVESPQCIGDVTFVDAFAMEPGGRPGGESLSTTSQLLLQVGEGSGDVDFLPCHSGQLADITHARSKSFGMTALWKWCGLPVQVLQFEAVWSRAK